MKNEQIHSGEQNKKNESAAKKKANLFLWLL